MQGRRGQDGFGTLAGPLGRHAAPDQPSLNKTSSRLPTPAPAPRTPRPSESCGTQRRGGSTTPAPPAPATAPAGRGRQPVWARSAGRTLKGRAEGAAPCSTPASGHPRLGHGAGHSSGSQNVHRTTSHSSKRYRRPLLCTKEDIPAAADAIVLAPGPARQSPRCRPPPPPCAAARRATPGTGLCPQCTAGRGRKAQQGADACS